MSYNILNKNVNFQGATKGTVEDLVDTHSTQTINGLKTVTFLTGTHAKITNDINVYGNVSRYVHKNEQCSSKRVCSEVGS